MPRDRRLAELTLVLRPTAQAIGALALGLYPADTGYTKAFDPSLVSKKFGA